MGSNHCRLRYLLAACLVFSSIALRAEFVASQTSQPAVAPPDLTAVMAQYRRALEAYNQAQQLYAAASSAYCAETTEDHSVTSAPLLTPRT